jgi:hypothetical protein
VVIVLAVKWSGLSTVVTTLFGGVGAIGAILAYWVARNVKTKLYWRTQDIVRLMPRGAEIEKLEVRFAQTEIKDPWLATVDLHCKGRHDIEADHFNGPIVIEAGAPCLGIIEIEWFADGNPDTVSHAGSQLIIKPGLVKTNTSARLMCLFDGTPDIAIKTLPLANVRQARKQDPQPGGFFTPRSILVALLILFSVYATIVSPQTASDYVSTAVFFVNDAINSIFSFFDDLVNPAGKTIVVTTLVLMVTAVVIYRIHRWERARAMVDRWWDR